MPHDVVQAEGGEQGDPLMPAFYALGQHNALHQARRELHPQDVLLAFLDDLYLLTTRSRATAAIQTVTRHVEASAGVRTHLGKLEAWSAARAQPFCLERQLARGAKWHQNPGRTPGPPSLRSSTPTTAPRGGASAPAGAPRAARLAVRMVPAFAHSSAARKPPLEDASA